MERTGYMNTKLDRYRKNKETKIIGISQKPNETIDIEKTQSKSLKSNIILWIRKRACKVWSTVINKTEDFEYLTKKFSVEEENDFSS